MMPSMRLVMTCILAILACVIANPAAAGGAAVRIQCLPPAPGPDDFRQRFEVELPGFSNADQEHFLEGFNAAATAMNPLLDIQVYLAGQGPSHALHMLFESDLGYGEPGFDFDAAPLDQTAFPPTFAGGTFMVNTNRFPGGPDGNRAHGAKLFFSALDSALNRDVSLKPEVVPAANDPWLDQFKTVSRFCGASVHTPAERDILLLQALSDALVLLESQEFLGDPNPPADSCSNFDHIDVFAAGTTNPVPEIIDLGQPLDISVFLSANNPGGCMSSTEMDILLRGNSAPFPLLDRRRLIFDSDPDYKQYHLLGWSPARYLRMKFNEIRIDVIDPATDELWFQSVLPISNSIRRSAASIMTSTELSPIEDLFLTESAFDVTFFDVDVDTADIDPGVSEAVERLLAWDYRSPTGIPIDGPGQKIGTRLSAGSSRLREIQQKLIQAQMADAGIDIQIDLYEEELASGGDSAALHEIFMKGFELGATRTMVASLILETGTVADLQITDRLQIEPGIDSSSLGDIFADGFESGDTAAWSSSVPRAKGRGPTAANGIDLPVAFMDVWRPDRLTAELRDVGSGAYLGDVDFLGASFRAWGFSTLADMNGNGAMEAMVLATRKSTGEIIVQVRDTETGQRLSNVYFLGPDFVPWRLIRLFDQNNNGADEILVLAYRKSDNAIIYQMRDSMTGDLLQNRYILGSGFVPINFRAVLDTDNDGIPQIAVLAQRVSDGRFVVQVVNATGTAAKHNVWFLGPQFVPLDLSIVPDSNGDGHQEIIVLAVKRSDGRFLAQVRNAAGPSAPRNYWFLNPDFKPLRVLGIPDTDGDGVPEIAILAWRYEQDGQFLIQIRNSSGPANPTNIWFMEAGFIPLNLFAFVDDNVQGGLRLGVLARRFRDRRMRVQIRNARGPAQPYDVWLKPAN